MSETLSGERSEPHGVLIVEDNAVVREVAVRILRDTHRVFVAATGQEALSVFQKEKPRVDVVLLDVALPDMSGIELYRLMEKRKPGLPVIFVTGFVDSNVAEFVAKLEKAAVLQKPYTKQVLRKKLYDLQDV